MINPATSFHQENTPDDSIESGAAVAKEADPIYSGAFTEIAKRIGQLDFQCYIYTGSKLPKDALLQIFFYEYRLKEYVEKSAFTAKDWNTYFGDVGEEPPLPLDIFEILNSPCRFWPDQKVQDTHFLCLIPKTVNGVPLSLDSLEDLVKNPKEGAPTKYRFYNEDVKANHGKKTVRAPHWVLMTKDVVPNSRRKTYAEQKQLVGSTPSYQLPPAIEAATVIFMHTFKTGKAIYTDHKLGDRLTYTRCVEKVDNRWPVAIGGLSAAGVGAAATFSTARRDDGAAGFRKFQ